MRAIPDELVRRYEREGWWTPDSVGDLLVRGLAAAPDMRFEVHSAVRPWSGTVHDVELVARRLAGGLRRRGVGAGDVIAFQLPNWMEAAAVFWASAFLGAVVVPIVHFYRRKELDYILQTVTPAVFVTADTADALPDPDVLVGIPIVGVVGSDFDDLLDDEPMPGVAPVDSADPTLIAFTSGTTRNPKGVIHSHRSLGCETRQLASQRPPDQIPQITAAPVGHFIGMISAFLIPIVNGTPVTLVDRWEPERILELMANSDRTVGGGVPYYFTSLLDHPDFTPAHLRRLRYAPMGGSSIPTPVSLRLAEAGIVVYRSYGSTEHPSITGSRYTAPEPKRLHTDGNAMPGVEVRLAEDGEVLSRGPDLCLGYTDPDLTAAAFDADGWYHTGDIAVLDQDGYLKITDRKADVIIRGGENISALEVEEALLTMPQIAEAAVVAAPDPRLGERAAAFVSLRPGKPLPSLAELREHFAKVGLAKQKWPEELHLLDDFPRTPSGKIQKFRLRQRLATSTGTDNSG